MLQRAADIVRFVIIRTKNHARGNIIYCNANGSGHLTSLLMRNATLTTLLSQSRRKVYSGRVYFNKNVTPDPADDSTTSSSDQKQTTLEINTKHGKLIVTTTVKNDRPQNVVIEKIENEKKIALEKFVCKSDDEKDENGDAGDGCRDVLGSDEDGNAVGENGEKLQVKQVKKRSRVDFNRSSLERNFITPARAMSDFLLKPSDLDNLAKTKRRSPYEQEPPIEVFWRKDVEAIAIEVWGTRENLIRECLKREIEKKKHQQNIFTVKRRLRDYRREIGQRTTVVDAQPGLLSKSGKVVLTAITINAVNLLFKIGAWLYTGSHSMFAECIHSFADTANQMILAYGIHKSTETANPNHPYGYSNMRYVSSLISGVGIFCVGTGLSIYHGVVGLMHPHPIDDFFWAFFILGGSFLSEGATLMVAVNALKHAAKEKGISFREYVMLGEDPCVNVVLAEDAAAVLSVALAAGCMGLSTYTGSSIPDAVGSLLVGGMLGAVASFIIYTNTTALVGRSIPQLNLNQINAELESDIMIRAIHDVKGIDMGSSLVRYKAEIDFDGRELSRLYLEKQDIAKMLEEIRTFTTTDELEGYILKHGENIVDLMGGEIDRIEMKLRKKFPEVRHVDLEIL